MQPAAIDAILDSLERWLRQEVAPVLSSGANCKAIINVTPGGDVRTVIEKHQAIVVGRNDGPHPIN
jgi:hypothetical protein